MLNDLVNMHIVEKNKGKLDKQQIQRLEKFLDMLNDDDTKYTDDSQRIYSNYKAYKINEAKLMVYNESDNKKLSTLTNMELEEKLFEDSNSNIDWNAMQNSFLFKTIIASILFVFLIIIFYFILKLIAGRPIELNNVIKKTNRTSISK